MPNPSSVEYRVETAAERESFVVIKTQEVDWEGRNVGEPIEVYVSGPEVEQLVGFCLRCGNHDLLRSVRRPVYRMIYGPDHPFANE